MFLTSVSHFAKIWQTAETYSPQTFSVTAAVVAPAVAICLNSLNYNKAGRMGAGDVELFFTSGIERFRQIEIKT